MEGGEEQEDEEDDNLPEGQSIFEYAREYEAQERKAMGGEPEIKGFQPAEVVWIIEAVVAKKYGRTLGKVTGAIYAFSTTLLMLFLWATFSLLLIKPASGEINPANLALITFTIGTFILISGSSLVDQYDERSLNFHAYIHNSITFILSGIAFLIGYVIHSYFPRFSFSFSVEALPTLLVIVTYTVGSLLFLLSIWTLLKILWRLNQLVHWDHDYPDAGPYSELKASIYGFYMGFTQGWNRSFARTIIGLILSICAFSIPYIITSEILWGIAGLITMSLLSSITSYIWKAQNIDRIFGSKIRPPFLIGISLLAIYLLELSLAGSFDYGAAYGYLEGLPESYDPIIRIASPFLHSNHGHIGWNVGIFFVMSYLLLTHEDNRTYILIFLTSSWATASILPWFLGGGLGFGISGANAALSGWETIYRGKSLTKTGGYRDYLKKALLFAIPGTWTLLMIGQGLGLISVGPGVSTEGHLMGALIGVILGLMLYFE